MLKKLLVTISSVYHAAMGRRATSWHFHYFKDHPNTFMYIFICRGLHSRNTNTYKIYYSISMFK